MTTWTEVDTDLMAPDTGDPTSDLVLTPATQVPDVSPSKWAISHNRRDTITQVVLGRPGDEDPLPPYDDDDGQALYGVETWTATDLVCVADSQLDRIAERILATRGWATANRVETVRIDASTTDAALDLLTELSVFEPSRYRCRLTLERGEIFDREMFATGVRVTMTPNEWTADISLDVASPWAASGARWDEDVWGLGEWNATL